MAAREPSRKRVDETELPDLWMRKKAGDPKAVARIVEIYAWRAEQLARSKKVPEAVELEDLVSWALFGLFDAVRKFDPDTSDGHWHSHFYSYASMRIRGAILDGLKAPSQSWASRQTWRLAQKQREAEEVLAQEMGRTPSRQELATHLGIGREGLVSVRQVISVGSTTFDGDPDDDQHGESSWVGVSDTPAEAETGLLLQRCATALGRLCEADQAVLAAEHLQGQKVPADASAGALSALRVGLASL